MAAMRLKRGDSVVVNIDGNVYRAVVQIPRAEKALVTLGSRDPGSILGALWVPRSAMGAKR